MSTTQAIKTRPPDQDQKNMKLLEQYGAGPIHFAGTDSGLYERHLLFDNVINKVSASARDRFEAFARSGRDVLSQRWTLTEDTYARENPKRIYYLSMEFLIGRSLANNVTNLLLDPLASEAIRQKNIDWIELIEQEPDAGLGNGGLGRLAACFLDSMATMQLPAMGYGLRYEYGMFQTVHLQNGWQQEQPDNWLRDGDPWEVARAHEKVEVKLNCSFKLRGGHLAVNLRIGHQVFSGYLLIGQWWVTAARPSTLSGFGLRLRPTSSIFRHLAWEISWSAVAETLEAESLTRVLYPDDSTTAGQGLRFMQEYFLVACSLADLVRRFLRHNTDWNNFPDKAAIQLNDTHPSMAVAELMRILLDDAHLGWDRGLGHHPENPGYTNHTLLPEALEKWPAAWFEVLLPRQLEIIYEINRRLLDEVRVRFPGDEGTVQRISLVEESLRRKIRMANLAIVGSHSTNGVAAIHSEAAANDYRQRPCRNVS